jgi:hypothetical protein
MAYADLPRCRRFDAVWTSLLCFLVQAFNDQGVFEEMGLDAGEETADGLLDIIETQISGLPEGRKMMGGCIDALCRKWIQDPHPNSATNPLLWWLSVLTQSAHDTSTEHNFISSGRFATNIMPVDVDLMTHIEAIQHLGKVFVFDMAFHTWQRADANWKLAVTADLDAADSTWIGTGGGQHPSPPDYRTCTSPARISMLQRLDACCEQHLGPRSSTVMHETRKFLGQHIGDQHNSFST